MSKKIAIVIPTWEEQCGIAEYTKKIVEYTRTKSIESLIIKSVEDFKLINKNIDLVHFQYEYSFYPFFTLYNKMAEIKRMNIPIATTLHTWSNLPQLKLLNDTISSLSTKIIVHSEEMRNLCIRGGYPEEKMLVMPMPCKVYPIKDRKEIQEERLISGEPIIGFFGFPFPHKGIETLIQSINQLTYIYPNIKGHFLSHYPNYLNETHPYYEFLNRLKVYFEGNNHLIWLKDYLTELEIVQYLHCMDIIVLPYKDHDQKGISAAVKMALAAKRPIVTTDYLYFSDLSAQEVYKLADEESQTLTKAIVDILGDPKLQNQLISNGTNYITKHSLEHTGALYSQFYLNI
ncbi:glycosyltransferase [Fictibacillus fluitans]|uniref:Glycosyltransferase n=1 Tax=Fictibacillus fluitans TaxID=3058422 RepID=A0ABT8HS83_9BACL|nr:glycosyltransferase [Fictibacillus sp. NE201]MDN4523633.1 glycosyltransferase [Fictibacillus sp. NE201]